MRVGASIALLICAAAHGGAAHDVTTTLVEVGGARGFVPYSMAGGLGAGFAAADYDDDGDVDIFVPNGRGVANQLYRNLGDGHFENIAGPAGVGGTGNSRGALWFDYDGDHDLDLLVTGDCFYEDTAGQDCPDDPSLRFFEQITPDSFVEVTDEAGLGVDLITEFGVHRGGAAAGDLNNDGWLDFVVGLWKGDMRVFLNTGRKSFVDVAPEHGMHDVSYYNWQPVLHDFDGNGWLDILYAVDFFENALWMSDGAGGYENQAVAAGVANAWNDMGIALGDYDNDGDLDFYVTEIEILGRHNVLYRNDSADGVLAFTEVAGAAGIGACDFAWGTTFLDVDNNRRLDLAVTNGFWDSLGTDDPSQFFFNRGDDPVTFANLSEEVGFDDTMWGSGLIATDLDRDGDLDLLQATTNEGPLRFLLNQRGKNEVDNGFLTVRPRMAGTNHRAIGATVRATAAGETMMRPITAGTSFMSQEPAEAFFGLGDAARVGSVSVEWPDGRVTCLRSIGPNRMIDVTDAGATPTCPAPADLDGDGTVCIVDLMALITGWGICSPDPCAPDLDPNGRVGFADLSMLLAAWGACP